MKLNVLAGLSRTLDPHDPEPCKDCGHCCHYITVSISAPRARVDYDEIRWFLLHENISVFMDDDGWYVEIAATCKHLDGYRCGIYATRPRICSDYGVENCERYGEGEPHLHRFDNEQEFLDFLRKHRPKAHEWVMNPRPAKKRAIAARMKVASGNGHATGRNGAAPGKGSTGTTAKRGAKGSNGMTRSRVEKGRAGATRASTNGDANGKSNGTTNGRTRGGATPNGNGSASRDGHGAKRKRAARSRE
jgi:Fe-S-cluster containining protein